MDWKVSSADGTRWVAYGDGKWTADPVSEIGMTDFAGRPVSLGVMAGAYAPTSADDVVGLYLLARQVVPGPVTVTGEPPQTPAVEWQPGVVY